MQNQRLSVINPELKTRPSCQAPALEQSFLCFFMLVWLIATVPMAFPVKCLHAAQRARVAVREPHLPAQRQCG